MKEAIKSWGAFILLICVEVYLLHTLPKTPTVWNFLTSNSFGLYFFLFAFVIICGYTFSNYGKTLGEDEEETKDTEQALKKNARAWISFWMTWSIYCAVITLMSPQIDRLVLLTAATLAIAPGIIAFLVSYNLRKIKIKEEETDKVKLGEKYYEQPPYYLFLEKKYHTGYYGLICIPLFGGITAIGILIKNCI